MSDLTLAIDTAVTVAVGIARDDEVLAEVTVADTRAHVEQLMPSVQQACAQAGIIPGDLTRVVVGLGPGPFTGLRVGIVTAQIIASTVSIDLHGICTLDALAAQAVSEGSPDEWPDGFVVTVDARRKELYWARYDVAGSRIGDPSVGPAAEIPGLPVVGPGSAHFAEVLADRTVPVATQLTPGTLAVHGPRLPDAGTEPLYLRRPDATVSTRRKSTLVGPMRRRRDR